MVSWLEPTALELSGLEADPPPKVLLLAHEILCPIKNLDFSLVESIMPAAEWPKNVKNCLKPDKLPKNWPNLKFLRVLSPANL